LHEDARPIACILLTATSSSMFKIQENLDRLLDDPMRFSAFNVNYEADTARIVFKPGII
jgi:hypothetical protein